ncbi:hypothetical protein EI94DRAFT_1814165 [Lactarius quietus]|nr:hypothetical protein EI94DRAFT_1814165 [Lactarius quietus]
MPRIARSTQGAAKKTPYAKCDTSTSHNDGATSNSDNAQWCSSSKGTDTRVKKGLNPVAENEEGRNVHPAGLPKFRRSKEQIQAEREAKKKATEEKTQKACMAKEHLAQMNLREECEDSLAFQHPPHLSVMIQKQCHEDMESDSDGDECFDLRQVECSSDSDLDVDLDADSHSESLKAAQTTTKPSRHKKRVKGAARQELMMRTEELRHGKECSAKRQKSKGSRLKTYISESEDDPFELGGISNADLEETRPTIILYSYQLVKIGGKFDVHFGKSQAKCMVPKLKASKAAAKVVAKVTTVKAAAKVMTVKAATKVATVKKHTSYSEDEFLIDVKPAATKARSADIAENCLKDYRWTNIFLPTLSHVLYVSEQPFKDWAWSSDALRKTVQAVFDISFPNILYTVAQQDCIMKAAYDRMKTQRSKITSDVLVLVQLFFNEPKFRKRHKKIRDYVRWALGSGGPAYYKIPVPESCMLRKGDPGFPKPDGFLCLEFVLPVAKTHIGYTARSVLQPPLGPRSLPKGLYAMILAAVERTMRTYVTGEFIAPGEFNYPNIWNAVQDFYGILDKLHEHHWVQILNFNSYEEVENSADKTLLSAFRIDFYLPSSPSKPDA